MPPPDDLGDLNSNEWRELQDCASRLERTLFNSGQPADLLRYLPPPGAKHRRAILLELIKTELEALYRKKNGLPLEGYLEHYPELGGADDLPASLVYEEYRVRRLYGDRPDLEVYRGRFPRQFEQVKALVDANPLPPTAYGTMTPSPPARPPASLPPSTVRADGSGGRTPSLEPATTPIEDSVSRALRGEYGGLHDLTGYQKLDRLGRGEFGEVWKALAPGGVEVALKFILRTLDHDATKRELKSLEKIRQLHHPFLLQTHSFGMLEGKLTIVMELADGSLTDRYKECKAQGLTGIPLEEVVPYFSQAAEALDYLHAQHVAHRDIKPQNLLSLQGFAKVADFGLARAQEQTVDAASVVCGTPYYMAPEVWKQQVHRHSDQYSLAATYVEVRLGRRLFAGKNPFEIAEQHIRGVPDLTPMPEAEQAVLKRALSKEPEKRFPSCVAFAEALKEATAPPPKDHVPPAGWRAKALVAGLGAALTAALVMVLVMLTRPGGNPATTAGGGPKIWKPKDWQPVGEATVEDLEEHLFYERLERDVGGEKVVLVAVPQKRSTDPPTFYIMENKVWNDLFAKFMQAPEREELFGKYRERSGAPALLREEWEKGGMAPALGSAPLGVKGQWGQVPAFRMSPMVAHCFAEWLGGWLPEYDQWIKAAGGRGESKRLAPFEGDPSKFPSKLENKPSNPEGLAVGLPDGPWKVSDGTRDVSIHGCRQMATNGQEWTRTLHRTENGEEDKLKERIPSGLDQVRVLPYVRVVGKSYASGKPLTFADLEQEPTKRSCDMISPEIGFRVVIEPPAAR